jgi:biopolymer transport protein ExbD
MVTSQLKEINPKIKVNLPTSSESKKLKKQSIRSYIYIGFNNNQKTVIQLNNNIATLNDIPDFIKKEREQLSVENKNNLIVTLKIDKKVPMGIVKDVKNKLRECDALVINYANKEINN